MRLSNPEAASWLRRLDSYTNAEFGRSRTLSAIQDICVACGLPEFAPNGVGLCLRCATQREPDNSEIVLFRPLRSRKNATPDRGTSAESSN
jgi:hypothetical protein